MHTRRRRTRLSPAQARPLKDGGTVGDAHVGKRYQRWGKSSKIGQKMRSRSDSRSARRTRSAASSPRSAWRSWVGVSRNCGALKGELECWNATLPRQWSLPSPEIGGTRGSSGATRGQFPATRRSGKYGGATGLCRESGNARSSAGGGRVRCVGLALSTMSRGS